VWNPRQRQIQHVLVQYENLNSRSSLTKQPPDVMEMQQSILRWLPRYMLAANYLTRTASLVRVCSVPLSFQKSLQGRGDIADLLRADRVIHGIGAKDHAITTVLEKFGGADAEGLGDNRVIEAVLDLDR
jgi:hypothetical protein